MSDVTLNGTSVTMCDWRGRVIWQLGGKAFGRQGEPLWHQLSKESAEQLRVALSHAMLQGDQRSAEVLTKRGQRYRVWLWPLDAPEAAVCILSMSIPRELDALTDREREILGQLALGQTTREIAMQLDLSPSTVHTHLRHARRKLRLPSVESLAGFAARYCHPTETPSIPKP